MTPEQFAYWLQGFVELTQGKTPNPAQWKSIQDHLGTVFKKVTPPVSQEVEVKIGRNDPSVLDAMRKMRDFGLPLNEAMQPVRMGDGGIAPGTIIC
jgi:hypothetical protein